VREVYPEIKKARTRAGFASLPQLDDTSLVSGGLHWLPDQPVQVLAVAVLLPQRCCNDFKLMIINPAIAPGNFFRAGDAQALTLAGLRGITCSLSV
jgi:hypothetical protein